MKISNLWGGLRAGVLAGVALTLALGLSACGEKKPTPPPPSAPAPVTSQAIKKPATNTVGIKAIAKVARPVTNAAVAVTNTTPAVSVVPLQPNKAISAQLPSKPAQNVPDATDQGTETNKKRSAVVTLPTKGDSVTNTSAQVEQILEMAFKAQEQGKPEVAIGLFNKALQSDPTNRRGRFGLSTVLIQTDKFKAALALLEELVKESPKDYVLKNNIAWVYATAADLSMRNGPRAIQLAQEALMLNTVDCHVWSTLAEAYFISGRYDKALRSAEQALRLGQDTKADAKLIEQYQLQVERCRKAAESMSILE
ncbi:MAG: tetratricopeptide repeat protein [Verrucomicrobia bacterium]|nr:MAG: tetratricopeptide repeat protein [Verrucomicrobiota bacterium]